MEEVRSVAFRLAHLDPVLSGRGTPEDRRKLAAWIINHVHDLVDDSGAFLEDELSRLGLDRAQVRESRERIERGLVKEWARWVLDLSRILPEGTPVLTREDVELFLRRKFSALV